ncbi:MAG: hypothetical protein R2708_25340 [Vicinamibacterales bacterium]
MRKPSRLFTLLSMLVALYAGPLAGQAQAQATFNATPSTLGAIPDSFGECGGDGPPRIVSVPVSGAVGGITTVSISMALTHTWMGEITATLIAGRHVRGSSAHPGAQLDRLGQRLRPERQHLHVQRRGGRQLVVDRRDPARCRAAPTGPPPSAASPARPARPRP